MNITTGSIVRDDHGKKYAYEGEGDHDNSFQMVFHVGSSALPGARCAANLVIPESAVPESFPSAADLKAAAFLAGVQNDKSGRPGTWAGSWRATLPAMRPRWFHTKREAVAWAAWRTLIRMYHGEDAAILV